MKPYKTVITFRKSLIKPLYYVRFYYTRDGIYFHTTFSYFYESNLYQSIYGYDNISISKTAFQVLTKTIETSKYTYEVLRWHFGFEPNNYEAFNIQVLKNFKKILNK